MSRTLKTDMQHQYYLIQMKSSSIGSSTARKSVSADKDFLELCALVEQVLPRHKSFAPWHYYVKAIGLLVAAVTLEVYIHYTNQYKWYLTAPLGLLFAWIGMNIQHDANHGAISRYPWVNKL
jgi:acyl-lipid (7-3)-desaturase (Delta-4 desaturase)